MTRAGVVDVGTNSVRVLVAEPDPDGRSLRSIERDLVITRLGEGVDRTGRLGEEPLRRTVAAVADFHRRCVVAGADRIRIAATSAVRDAANRDEFFAAVREATGRDAEVISGEEEARLGFLGATASLPASALPAAVLDLGGGSTEIVFGTATAQRWASMQFGSVRLTERHVRSDPPLREELDAVAADVGRALAEADRTVRPGEARTLVGLAGTITTMAAVVLGLEGYDRDRIHHVMLALGDVGATIDRFASMTSAERRALPAMPRGREDVIVAGAVALACVMERYGFAECLVSEDDILDGLARSLIGAERA